jgi:hypothetical protein
MKSVSPAIGSYDICTFINIDRGITGASTNRSSGVTGSFGVTGNQTLEPWKYDIGLTGINSDSFRNITRKW